MKYRLFIPIIAGTLMLALPQHQAEASDAVVGQAAPAFTLTDTDGKEVALSDFAGKLVVLEWINHGCPFVKKFYNAGKMQELQKTYGEQGVIWLSICSSAPGRQGHYPPAEFNAVTQEKGASPYAVLLDEDGQVGRAYGAKKTPHMYVIDADGILAYQGAIDSIRSADASDIPKADNYVVDALEALKAGEDLAVTSTDAYGCGVKYAD